MQAHNCSYWLRLDIGYFNPGDDHVWSCLTSREAKPRAIWILDCFSLFAMTILESNWLQATWYESPPPRYYNISHDISFSRSYMLNIFPWFLSIFWYILIVDQSSQQGVLISMKFSTRARYGTRALLGIVLHWDEVKKAVDSVLESTTFEDLVERQKQKLSQWIQLWRRACAQY